MPPGTWIALLLATPLAALAGEMNRALVVIDMQQSFIARSGTADRPSNRAKVKKILDAQVEAIQRAKLESVPIVFIEYEGYGPTLERLQEAAQGAKEVTRIPKSTDGIFDIGNTHEKELTAYLARNHVGTLILTGINGAACVKKSTLGSLKRNLNVVTYDRAIGEFNTPRFIYPYDSFYRDKIEPAAPPARSPRRPIWMRPSARGERYFAPLPILIVRPSSTCM